jgi:hypothetical protein
MPSEPGASEEAIAADSLTKSKILLKVRSGGVEQQKGGMDPKLAAMIARRRAGKHPIRLCRQ